MRRSCSLTFVLIVGVLQPLSAQAAVLRVDKAQPTPPGVFTTIQAAVEASAPNDTISIANGRYDELERYVFPSGDVVFPVVAIEHAPLTLIGDSRDGVRIGPSYYIGPLGDGTTLCVASPVNDLLITFRSLTMENTYWLMSTASSVRLESCLLTTIGQGGLAFWASQAIEVANCRFEDLPSGTALWVTYTVSQRTEQLRVSDSEFVDCGYGVSLLGVEQVEITNTRFTDCGTGTQFDDDTVGAVTNSWFEGNAESIVLFDGSRCHLERVVSLANVSQGLLTEHGHFTGSHNYIEGGAGAAVQVRGIGTASIQNSTLLNGGGWTVHIGSRKSYFPIVPRFDFTNNYWGTTNVEQIRTWILDEEENPLLVGVDFEPILDQSPVRSDRTSFGELKQLFHPPKP